MYETEPVGGPDQGCFLNAALLVGWQGEPLALLDVLQRIELDLGRTREVRWGPRTIDLDILWICGGERVDLPRLVVPHPRLAARAFALAPLRDVDPEALGALGAEEDLDDPAAIRCTELSLAGA